MVNGPTGRVSLFRFKDMVDRLAEPWFIVLLVQNPIRLLLAYLCGEFGPAAHRVDSHDGLRQIEQFRQWGITVISSTSRRTPADRV